MTARASNPEDLPGRPPSLPVVGHAPAFLRDRLGFLQRCARDYGDVVELNLGGPTYLLSSAADIKHVLGTNHANYGKSPRLTSSRGKRLSGEGLLTATSGPQHMRIRRQLQPAFLLSAIEPYSGLIVRHSQQWISSWQAGEPLDIAAELMQLVQSNITRALLGRESEEDLESFAEAIRVRRRYISHVFRSLFPWPEYLPVPLVWQYRQATRRMDGILHRAIAKRLESAETSRDLLSQLVSSRDEEGRRMSVKQLRDEAMTLALTGYETIGEALAWTCFLVSQHPEVEEKLVAEIGSVVGGRDPSAADVSKLRYTTMVLEEAMRLYPPTWIFLRVANGRDRLPSGVEVQPGSTIYLCQFVVHRHPRYFPDPDRFDPERFSEEAREDRPRFAYFPFGGGPRQCIGEPLARLECLLILAVLYQRFRFELVPGQTIVPEPGITLRPSPGVWVQALSSM